MSRYLLGRLPRCEHCGAVRGANAPLTRKQASLYDFLVGYVETNGFAPTFVEIACEFGYRSPATVHEHLANLERKGWIRRKPYGARAIECLVAIAEGAA